jgi:hypothetical protein
MTALTLERAPVLFDEPSGGGPTLDAVISSAWEAVRSGAEAPCPVCSGELVPVPPEPGGGVPRACCSDCGSELR